jgi:hypothetical protein
MARVVGNVVGNLKGKLGNLSARTVNGKTIMAARPSSYKESTTPKHVETKQRFAVTTGFASKVSNLPALNAIWKLNKQPGISVINTIFQKNFDLSSTQAPSLNNVITPDGFGSPVTAAAIAAGKLTGSLAALNTITVVPAGAVNLSINAVISLTDPKISSDPFFKVMSVSKEVANFVFGQVYNFEIDFDLDEAGEVAKYNQKFIYLAVAIKSADDQIIKYSKSYSLISN